MSLFGKLTLNDLTFLNDHIVLSAFIFATIVAAIPVFFVLKYKKLGYLWSGWLTSVDHKKIGTMYIIVALIMFVRGLIDALMMRAQQAVAAGSDGYLPPEHFDQIFTAHGVIMIFFVAMPLMFGLLNWIIPLQIGARDVAFPFLNSLSFWFFVAGALLSNISLFVGDFAGTGWLAYPPLSGIVYSPGVGVDYYIWALQISGIGSLLSGVNFFVTILKMRTKGMSLMKMSVFCWSSLTAMALVMITFPILTVTLGLLTLDRYFGTHFFTVAGGGNPMMYVNLIWMWGHPEVYILILPAFGIFSEVVPVFSKKKLFGYTSLVWATVAIALLSFIVWAHHFFTMGAGANVNAFFGIATMIISIPTGVKIFNWLFTMYRGRITFSVPMYWTMGFLLTFTIGGMTGVMLAIPALDFQLHNNVFLVAHFHNVIIGGVVFGYFAGLIYWFPKIFGFKLDEKLGKISFYFWIIGFIVAFTPLYILGFLGMTRRLVSYPAETGWQPFLIVAAIGGILILIGVIFLLLQLIVPILKQSKYKVGSDPWDGRTLEWSIPSPAPFYNFAHEPEVSELDDFWDKKQNNKVKKNTSYEDIHMPKNSMFGILIGGISLIFGFAMTWHIVWLSVFSFLAIIIAIIVRSMDTDVDYYVKADEVKKIEESYKLK